MRVDCPNCQARLRYGKPAAGKRQVVIRCPACQGKFKFRIGTPVVRAILAHEDGEICHQLAERIAQIGGTSTVGRSEDAIVRHFQSEGPGVLFLDVAFNGIFPFELIEQLNAAGNAQQKIVLLPSVYNRAAYKKSPDSLYGADAYLELHHIGDRLLPLLGDLFPQLSGQVAQISSMDHVAGERSLPVAEVSRQAETLARLLVADIVFYHRQRLEQGLESGQLVELFAEPLAEGRRLLKSRLPAAGTLPVDFIQQAFAAVCQSYLRS